jgi:hypothetical protein
LKVVRSIIHADYGGGTAGSGLERRDYSESGEAGTE